MPKQAIVQTGGKKKKEKKKKINISQVFHGEGI